MRGRILALCLLALPLAAGDHLGKLPGWAQGPAREALLMAPPPGAEAWVLLDRREVTCSGDGSARIHGFRLVRVLHGKGLEEATVVQDGLEGQYDVTSLKGWNLRPDGELVRLERKDKITFGALSEDGFDRSTKLVAQLQRVMEGSLVALETRIEVADASFGLAFQPMQLHPVKRWELAVAEGGPRIATGQFKPWLSRVEGPAGGALAIADLPALPKEEAGCRNPGRFLPWVEVRFQDTHCADCRILDSWDRLAQWTCGLFAARTAAPPGEPPLEPGLQGLRTLWRWLGKELVYKQVYLTKDRGFTPEEAREVARKRYGDCKDLTCLFLARARAAGFEGCPALARINEDPIDKADVAGPPRNLFNHVLAALRLEHTLGLPAEVETPRGRFLLVDATDPLTPLGRMSEAHRGAHLLLCLPEGGQWVSVPEAALLGGEWSIHLTGTVQPSGRMASDVLLKETGDCEGLRQAAHTLTAAGFRAYLEAELLDQSLNGNVEVLGTSDPLALDGPFEVRLRLVDPRGLARQGSAWVLRPPLGLPFLPAPATLPGRKRQLPVALRGSARMVLTGTLGLPIALRPLAGARTGESSFRTLSWTVGTEPAATGCTLTFRVEQTRKDAFFGFDRLDQGVAAWKEDRALVRSLLEDGLALAAQP